jgi:hypothetical protein
MDPGILDILGETDPSASQDVQNKEGERLLESLHTKSKKNHLPDPVCFEGRQADFKA